MEDFAGNEIIQELFNSVERDMLLIHGYMLMELAPHTTPEGLIENCSRATNIDPVFIREYLNECQREYFNKLLRKD